jgi:hypothetical protein
MVAERGGGRRGFGVGDFDHRGDGFVGSNLVHQWIAQRSDSANN